VKHVILFIGDGMQLEHESAGGRYLYDRDFGLARHYSNDFRGYAGYVSTWDVSAYNNYASTKYFAAPFDPTAFDPVVGYDPSEGGAMPYPLGTVPEDGYFFDIYPGGEVI
jgi:alkaline phosphatase